MRLVSLRIYNGDDIVRELVFHNSLNIITNNGDNGNQIGKSTVLRAISFCLGSDIYNLWKDPENKNSNQDVKDFILKGDVSFELMLKGSVTHKIIRRAYEKATKIKKQVKILSWINEQEFNSIDGFRLGIARLFNYHQDSPSFGSIKSKFTRINRATSNNSYKFLDVHTKKQDYILIYSTLFGFSGVDLLKKEIKTKKDISIKEKRISALLNGKKLLEISDALINIDNQIEHYSKQEEEVDLTALQLSFIAELKEFRIKISTISSEVANLETRIIYNNKTIEKYKENQVSVDVDKISSIYKEALGYIPAVTKSLEETISFHNAIFTEKALQAENRANLLAQELSLKKDMLVEVINLEKDKIRELTEQGQLTGIVIIEKEIRSLIEQRGRLEFVVDEVKKMNREIRQLSIDLQQVKAKVESLLAQLKKNVDTFNVYFTDITRKLFKKHSNSLNVDIDEEYNMHFSLVNSEKNTGDGTPRAEAMAFDIAFVAYAKEKNKNLPEFTLQDYLESIDEEKLNTLFQFAESNEIQLVVSILKDKIQHIDSSIIERRTILELSSTDKLFKL